MDYCNEINPNFQTSLIYNKVKVYVTKLCHRRIVLRISTFLECLIFIPCRKDCIDGYRSLRFCIGRFNGI